MKRIVLVSMMIFTIITYAQKKKNGTVYVDHPAIDLVESMEKAFVEGDEEKVASYLADDFESWNGLSDNKDAKGGTKERFVSGVEFWKENVSYMSIERSKGAYPDAIEYKKDNKDDEVWVQTWSHLKGVHNTTGVKLDVPFHRLYVVNKDNKIKTIINYMNESLYDEIGNSFVERKNGVLYNHHEYINTVRRLMHAFENDDDELYYSFYDKDARFDNINMPIGETIGIDELKENEKKFKENFEINSIDVRGYPDYLNYEKGNAKIVQSWWTVRLTRKSDKKKIVIPMMVIHDFNDEGKIIRESNYYSDNLLSE